MLGVTEVTRKKTSRETQAEQVFPEKSFCASGSHGYRRLSAGLGFNRPDTGLGFTRRIDDKE
jgi:hypothetical protein